MFIFLRQFFDALMNIRAGIVDGIEIVTLINPLPVHDAALLIGINEQDLFSLFGKSVSQVDGNGCLAHPSLLIDQTDDHDESSSLPCRFGDTCIHANGIDRAALFS